ncbi:hypothetical protein ACOME3_009112 [Neoechinorhynchus agilis]
MFNGSFHFRSVQKCSQLLSGLWFKGFTRTISSVSSAKATVNHFYEHDGPERDLIGFPNPKANTEPARVRLGFIPDEWFTFFYEKTGVTGPYVFSLGLINLMLSKEFYIIWFNTNQSLAIIILLASIHKFFGPRITAYVDKNRAERYRKLLESIENKRRWIEHRMDLINKIERAPVVYELMADAKRETVALQLESELRERNLIIYNTFAKQLEYQAAVEEAQLQLEREYRNEWLNVEVMKSITTKLKDQVLDQCIEHLYEVSKDPKVKQLI